MPPRNSKDSDIYVPGIIGFVCTVSPTRVFNIAPRNSTIGAKGAWCPHRPNRRKLLFVCQVDWNARRHSVCPLDAYSEVHPAMRLLQNILAVYERWFCVGPIR